MKIAELFVELGVKGTDKAKQGLTSVKTGMGEIYTSGLAAKAAILAAMYALEQMVQQSNQAGTELTSFANATGLSAETLQRWQYAGRQFGVTAQETSATISGLQRSMTQMLLTGQAPGGMAMLASKVGFDPARARDTLYVMQKLQEYAKVVPADMARSVLGSFGLGDSMIGAMRKGAFNPEAFAKANIYSDREAMSLMRMNAAWGNLSDKIQKAVGHLNAKHGGALIRDITKIADAVLRLTSALITLAEKLHVFDGLAKVINFIEGLVKDFAGEKTPEKQTAANTERSKKETMAAIDWVKNMTGFDMVKYINDKAAARDAEINANKTNTQTVQVNQNLNFQHEGKDAKRTADSVSKSVQNAFRQMPSLVQGN